MSNTDTTLTCVVTYDYFYFLTTSCSAIASICNIWSIVLRLITATTTKPFPTKGSRLHRSNYAMIFYHKPCYATVIRLINHKQF